MARPVRELPLAVRRPWAVVVAAIVLLAAAGAFGGSVAELLVSGGFEDPEAESSRAADLVVERFDGGVPNVVAIVDGEGRSVDDPAVAAVGQELTAALGAEAGVAEVASYWSLGNAPPLRSTDGTKAMVLVRLDGTENEILERAEEILAVYDGPRDGVTVDVGGQATTFAEVNTVIEEDLVTAEMIALPITLVLLVLVFGSVVAGLLPLGIGGFAILGTFGVLRIIASLTDVSIFALNFTTAIGLGLAIDYALLIVSRYREELAAGFDVPVAVARTVRTAGRTVVFSAATVASSLAALLVFRISFLRSFAYAGIAVVALAAVGAVVVLPAILRLVGHNVDRLRVRKPRVASETEGTWHRIAVTVMRRPIPIATVAIAFLALLGLPFLGVELGFPDDRVLPASAETRSVGDTIREDFTSREAGALNIVADGTDAAAAAEDIGTYAAALSRVPGVARVDAATGIYAGGQQVVPPTPMSARFAAPDATYLSVVPSVEPISPEGEALVADVRAVPAPFDVVVGGGPAELVDGKAGLLGQLPLAMVVIAIVTFIVLFLQFGSVLVPVKAIALNLLSLSATFGAMVWIFQEGHLSDLLGFTPTGSLVASMPVLMFCIAFGLSMDYEVFLLSRIKEEYDRTGDNEMSVALGLERTGRIVTAAAVLISVVFIAFATSRVSFMKMFGIGMALAVLVDAFLVRAALVPAFMRLAGSANWWAPEPLRRLHDRFGWSEHVDLDAGDGPAGPGGGEPPIVLPEEPVVPSAP